MFDAELIRPSYRRLYWSLNIFTSNNLRAWVIRHVAERPQLCPIQGAAAVDAHPMQASLNARQLIAQNARRNLIHRSARQRSELEWAIGDPDQPGHRKPHVR